MKLKKLSKVLSAILLSSTLLTAIPVSAATYKGVTENAKYQNSQQYKYYDKYDYMFRTKQAAYLENYG